MKAVPAAKSVYKTKKANFYELKSQRDPEHLPQSAPNRFARLEISSEPHDDDLLEEPSLRETFLLNTHVAGTSYVDLTDFEPEVNAVFLLEREPENPFDALAILILDAQGNKLGYVPQAKNEILARLLDAGKLMRARLVGKQWFKEWLRLDIQIFLYD